jgi:hypothetical protein
MVEVVQFTGTSVNSTRFAFYQWRLKVLSGLWILAMCYTAVTLSRLLPEDGFIWMELVFLALPAMEKTGHAIMLIGV